MKRFLIATVIALSATCFMLYQRSILAKNNEENKQIAMEESSKAEKKEVGTLTIRIDKTSLNNGGTITVSGTAPIGKPVYLEVWAQKKVRASYFDAKVDKQTGKRPYIFYMTKEMPAYYKIFVPKKEKETFERIKAEGKKWSPSKALKDMGAEAAYSVPVKIKIDRYQTSLIGSIMGSRGRPLPQMNEEEHRKRSIHLVKTRFRDPEKLLGPCVEVKPDGTYKAQIRIRKGLAPGKYNIVAIVDKHIKSQPLSFENKITFPTLYLSNAGTSINLFLPFLLAFVVCIFGVLMGAGGGFILNPLLVTIWPFPHTIVAGTVMPTVLFSQMSGIYNYSKIKFINWKLGIIIGLSMLLGAFIGPKLTELITLAQYKFFFGLILIILAALMFWQTTPRYLQKNKREQAILKEFKERAAKATKAKEGGK
jgi:hypothetical protein